MKRDFEQIYESALKFLAPLPTESTFRMIVNEAVKLSGASYGSVFLAKGNVLRRVYSDIPKRAQIEPRKDGFTYQGFHAKKPFVIAAKEIQRSHPEAKKLPLRRIIMVPLSYDNQRIGVITLQANRRIVISKNRLQTLQLFGSLATLKIQTVFQLEEKTAAVNFLEQYAALASHELKTPLSTALLYTQLLSRERAKNKLPNPRTITIIEEEINRMRQLIDEFLNVEQIRMGHMQFRWSVCNIVDMVQKIIEKYHLSYPERKFVSQLDIPATTRVLADRHKIEEVLINILNNAIKYSSKGSAITTQLEEEKDFVSIKITDQGIGIEESKIPQLFEPFTQGEEKKAGMGMGLFLSRVVIHHHKGSLTIRSTVGKGTTAIIKLPKLP